MEKGVVMESVVVRIYRIEEKTRSIIGTAQCVSSEDVFSFSSIDELWFILYSQFKCTDEGSITFLKG